MTAGLHGLPVPAFSDSDPKDKPRLSESQKPAGAEWRPFVLPSQLDSEREALFGRLLFAAHHLAAGRISRGGESGVPDHFVCKECLRRSAFVAGIVHDSICWTGVVLANIYAIAKLPEPASPPKEDPQTDEARFAKVAASLRSVSEVAVNRVCWDMTPEEAERQNLCYQFCEGIPTEDLQRELPLASPLRRRFHEIQFLRRALPFLQAVKL